MRTPKQGHCYQNAYYAALDLEKIGHDVKICHGFATGTGGDVEGTEYSHAWVEWQGLAFDYKFEPGKNPQQMVFPVAIYYEAGQVDPEKIKRYSTKEMDVQLCRSGHWGPYEEG